MNKTKIISLIAVTVIGTTFITTAAMAQKSENSDINQTVSLDTNIKSEKIIAKAFSESALNEKYAEEDFKSGGFKDSDLRKISEIQMLKMSKTVNSDQAKEYIFDRMLNTMDFYKTLEGSFVHEQFLLNKKFTVDYAALNGDNPKCYEKLQYDDKTNWYENVYNNGVVMDIEFTEPDTNTISKSIKNNFKILGKHKANASEVQENDTVAIVKSKSRKKIDKDGNPVWYYRQESNRLSVSRESLSPQEMAFGFLNNFSTWNIEKQEEYIGRNCCVISGSLSGDYGAKLKTSKFKLWVDIETGVLLQSKQWNANGDLVDSITTTSFKVNQEIDQSVFSPSWFNSEQNTK